MKNFWPHRSDAKGFSIEKLARKYREKILDFSSSNNSKELLAEANLKSFNNENTFNFRSYISVNRKHWANRDFAEYRDVA